LRAASADPRELTIDLHRRAKPEANSAIGRGGAEGDRTPDLRIANAALSQLSYGPDPSKTDSPEFRSLVRRRARRNMGKGWWAVKRASACSQAIAFPVESLAKQGLALWATALADRWCCGYRRRICPSTGYRMRALLWLINTIIEIYVWLLIAQAILSWLLACGVINRYNRSVSVIGDFLYRITEPALRPIRAMLPNFGGIDISPIVLILILYFLQRLIDEDIAPYLLSAFP
jgi:YggT family protein